MHTSKPMVTQMGVAEFSGSQNRWKIMNVGKSSGDQESKGSEEVGEENNQNALHACVKLPKSKIN